MAFELSKKLVERGHEVTVYTTDAYDAHSRLKDYKNPEVIEGVEVFRFRNVSNNLAHMNFPFAPGMALALRKNIDKFDVVHLHEYRSFQAIFVHNYAVKHRVPYVLQAHGALSSSFQKSNLKSLYDRLIGNQMLQNSSRIIALTNLESEQCKSMGLNPSKIEITMNGIELREFNNLPEKGEFRASHSISIDEYLVLFLGRIHAIKGINLLLESFADLANEMDNVRLIIVGPDHGYLLELNKKIDYLGIANKVLITGPLYGDEKLRALVDADVFVLSSIYETFPMTVLEAFACNTPVVMTDSCGIADIVSNNCAGLVSSYNKQDLKECISKIILDENLRNRLSSRGRELVNRSLNLDRCIDNIYNVYVKVIEK